MRARSRPDDRVAEAAQRRLEALVAELDGQPVPNREEVLDASRVPAAPRDGAAAGGGGDQPGEDGAELERDNVVPQGPQVGGRHARQPLPRTQRAALWAGDRVPMAAARLTLGARHLVVVCLLLATGLALAGWSHWEATRGSDLGGEVVAPRASGGVPVEVPPSPGDAAAPVEPRAASAGAAPVTGQPSAAGPAAEVVVDVEGKVRRPGIAVLPVGSRVVDALEAAGGARPGTDLRDLNLARVLVDGEQLLVGVDPAAGVAAGHLATPAPAAPPAGASSSGSQPVALVDLNTADQAMLETLPGVGPVTAASILEWRTQNGAFTSVDELLEVSGIGEATLAEIAPHVTL